MNSEQTATEQIETNSFPAVARLFPNGRIISITGRSGASMEQYSSWKKYEPEIPLQTANKLVALLESAARLGIRKLQFRIQSAAGENEIKTFAVSEL